MIIFNSRRQHFKGQCLQGIDYWKDQDIIYEYESKINLKLQGNSQDEELVL